MNKKLVLTVLAILIALIFIFLSFFSSKPTPKDADNPKKSTPLNSPQDATTAVSSDNLMQSLKNVNTEENYPLLVKLRVPYGDSRFAISWREDMQAPWGVVVLALPKGNTSAGQAVEYTKAYIASRGVPPETIKIEAGTWKE